jgi:hypothetical protein
MHRDNFTKGGWDKDTALAVKGIIIFPIKTGQNFPPLFTTFHHSILMFSPHVKKKITFFQ